MEKILYIDDDPDALELYRDILSEEFKVDTCIKAKEGLKLLKSKEFDAILLDVYMPEVDGFSLYEEIRKINDYRQTPVFFISSENTVQNRVKAFGLGSEDFIDRYMEPKEVLARIKSRLRKPQRKETLSFGDIKIDLMNLLVHCREELVELTQTEFRLLYLLVKESLAQPGAIIDRDSIITFVWPQDHENVFPRTLSTHMTNLRKKLGSEKVKFNSIRQSGFQLELV